MSARNISFGLVGLSLVALLSACGRVQQVARPQTKPWPNGTGQVSYTQYGLTDTYVYGKPDLNGKEYGIICNGEKNQIKIEFVESFPKREYGETHLTVIGSHPEGSSSKPSDLPAATFKLQNWPPNGKARKVDTYEQSVESNRSTCKLNYRKEGHRGIGTFDCQGLHSLNAFERSLREHPTDPMFAPAPIRIHGDFNCYVYEDEEQTSGPASLPEKPIDFRERDYGQRPQAPGTQR